MLHSDTPLIVEMILEGFRIREQSTVSYPKQFCRFQLRGNTTPPPYFEAEYCLFCGRRRVAVARYRMICLVLLMF